MMAFQPSGGFMNAKEFLFHVRDYGKIALSIWAFFFAVFLVLWSFAYFYEASGIAPMPYCH